MSRVGVGLPVHNGAQYLDAALTALRNQDFDDLEIVVCENASTDATLSIARTHADADRRVRVEASENLLTAVDNFNRCVTATTSGLFMWAAHDDVYEPSYVSSCVEALSVTGAQACVTDALVIDAAGLVVGRRTVDVRLASDNLRDRLRAHAQAADWLELYALYHRSCLPRQPGPMTSVPGGDVVLTWELLQRGPLAVVSEPLLRYRRSSPRYKTALESSRATGAAQAGRSQRGLNLRLWLALWQTCGVGRTRRVARQELVRALTGRAWLRRLRDDLRAELALRRGAA